MESKPKPDPIPVWVQAILGMTAGAFFSGLTTAVGYFRIPTSIYEWIALYALLWIGVFFAPRRRLLILVITAFLTLSAITLLANHYLFPTPTP